MSEILMAPELSGGDLDDPRRLYTELMKKTLTRYAFGETWQPYEPRRKGARGALVRRGQRLLHRRGLELVSRFTFDADARANGRDWPPDAETMVGLRRLDNVEHCVLDVLRQRVPGDLIETGVWRGGTVIFMRALLAAYADRDRKVWVADSFRGLPKPDAHRVEDVEDALWTVPFLAVSLSQVKQNFRRYGLLDDQVRFLPGWFEETLPGAPVDRIAVMRLDGDLYDSTSVALRSLYPKLSVGGYVIIDDYHAVRGCRQAVDDFRAEFDITDELVAVDWTCRYWRRTR
ncbi:TylF/MycF/NovP-related O-methyltransferase [Micromonospora sp. WMMD1102]|uniref:TylF/MycF/NovP-related O-methyltransferase n=1 Tax=Micromonospora sp. WMMD1102 TaxID=3016105 RepID=UPI002414DC3E|nr:TylF/MycF/NovP-related O-methyltransferase [Micromonospora sp. WMMD1102]MDG4786339.1 TylF/MycF/NovP-related O-methyltransferase [Micromonospora sp. WMMD1102]